MIDRNWVENTILGIIVLNITVLAVVFLIPRAQFMMEHWGWSKKALMESSGARDTPNQYPRTYKIANSIREITAEDSMIFMPPEKLGFSLSHSVIIQRLYPRKVYFSGDHRAKSKPFQIPNWSKTYIVFNRQWGQGLCLKERMEYLEEKEFGICRAGKLNISEEGLYNRKPVVRK